MMIAVMMMFSQHPNHFRRRPRVPARVSGILVQPCGSRDEWGPSPWGPRPRQALPWALAHPIARARSTSLRRSSPGAMLQRVRSALDNFGSARRRKGKASAAYLGLGIGSVCAAAGLPGPPRSLIYPRAVYPGRARAGPLPSPPPCFPRHIVASLRSLCCTLAGLLAYTLCVPRLHPLPLLTF